MIRSDNSVIKLISLRLIAVEAGNSVGAGALDPEDEMRLAELLNEMNDPAVRCVPTALSTPFHLDLKP